MVEKRSKPASDDEDVPKRYKAKRAKSASTPTTPR